MFGVLLDLKVIHFLMSKHLPKLVNHLVKMDWQLDLNLIMNKWLV